MNSAARVVSNYTGKFDSGLSRLIAWRAPLARRHRPSTIQARRADVSCSLFMEQLRCTWWTCQLHISNRRRCWSSVFCGPPVSQSARYCL